MCRVGHREGCAQRTLLSRVDARNAHVHIAPQPHEVGLGRAIAQCGQDQPKSWNSVDSRSLYKRRFGAAVAGPFLAVGRLALAALARSHVSLTSPREHDCYDAGASISAISEPCLALSRYRAL